MPTLNWIDPPSNTRDYEEWVYRDAINIPEMRIFLVMIFVIPRHQLPAYPTLVQPKIG